MCAGTNTRTGVMIGTTAERAAGSGCARFENAMAADRAWNDASAPPFAVRVVLRTDPTAARSPSLDGSVKVGAVESQRTSDGSATPGRRERSSAAVEESRRYRPEEGGIR